MKEDINNHSWLDFESTSQFCKLAQFESNRSSLDSSIYTYIEGINLIPSGDRSLKIQNARGDSVIGSKTLETFLEKTKIEVNKIIDFFKERDIEISFIEISTFDPLDITEVDHYYLFFASSPEQINIYNRQTNINVSSHFEQPGTQECSERGYILPSVGLFRHPYCLVESKGKLKALSLSDNNFLRMASGRFLLDEKSSVISDLENLTKRHTENFLKNTLDDFLDLDSQENSEFRSYGLLIPILRPAGRRKDYISKFEEKNDDEFRYRGGGIFIFCSSDTENINWDRLVLDFNVELRDKGIMGSAVSKLAVQEEASNSFGHEIKHIVGGLSGSWLLDPKTLFEVEYNSDCSISTDKIGRIEVWQSEVFDQMYIAPFREFTKTVHSLITLWTGQYKRKDLPFGLDLNVEKISLKEIIEKAWDFTVDVIIIGSVYNASPENINQINRIKKICKAIRHLYSDISGELIIPDSIGDYVFSLSNEKDLKCVMNLTRILCCVFSNSFKHLDPTRPHSISLERVEKNLFLYFLNYSLEKTELLQQDKRIDLLFDYSSEEKRLFRQALRMVLQSRKTSNALFFTTSSKTKTILLNLLRNLDGKLIEFGFVDPSKKDKYKTTISFEL